MPFLSILAPFWPAIWRAIAGAIVMAALWWAWSQFTGHYVDVGVAKERGNTLAAEKRAEDAEGANAALQADLGLLQKRVELSEKSVKALTDAEIVLSTENKALRAKNAAKEQALRAEAGRLATEAAAPPAPTREKACDEADRTSAEYSAHRLRD